MTRFEFCLLVASVIGLVFSTIAAVRIGDDAKGSGAGLISVIVCWFLFAGMTALTLLAIAGQGVQA